VLLEFGEDASGVGLVHDQNVVEHLSSDRADDALAVGVHARRLGCTLQHIDAFSLEDGVEGVGVLAVAVAKQESERFDARSEVGGEVSSLLGRPLSGGVRSDAGDVEPAGAMFQERQRVQPSTGDRVDVEEVRRDDPIGLGGEELPPARAVATRGRIDAGRVQDLPDLDGAIECLNRASSPWIRR
jgi:hypothetical protein